MEELESRNSRLGVWRGGGGPKMGDVCRVASGEPRTGVGGRQDVHRGDQGTWEGDSEEESGVPRGARGSIL